MLVLSRTKDQSIVVNPDVTIVIVEVLGNRVRLGLELSESYRADVENKIRCHPEARLKEIKPMPQTIEPNAAAAARGRYAVVVSRYNHSITEKLLAGAVQTLSGEGQVSADAIDVAWVPGAWELPLVVKRLAESGKYEAVIALGAVIRGETTHDQHINRAVSLGLSEISLASGVPVLFGLLTCESLEQAIHRSGGNVGNKGIECAQAALEMVGLLGKLPAATSRRK